MKKMFRVLIITAMAIVAVLPVNAMLLQGNAEYNAGSAREEAFREIRFNLSPDAFRDFWTDPNHYTNYQTLKNGKSKVSNRILLLFSDGTYGVRYTYDPYHNYYYDENGILFKVDVLDKPFDVYPHRSVAYNRYGGFKNATFVVSKDEQYLYDINKNLIGHWIDSACYDEYGNVLLLRKNAQ